MHEQYIASLIHILLPNSPHRTKVKTAHGAACGVSPRSAALAALRALWGLSVSALSLSVCVSAACPPSAAFALRAPPPGHGAARLLRACAGRAVHRAASTASASRRERRTVHASQISQVKSSQVKSSVTEMKVGQPAQVCSFLTVRAERRSCDTHATSAERDWDPWNDGWRVLP